MHVLAPAAELAAKPLPGAVAVMTLAEALAAGGGGRGVSRGARGWLGGWVGALGVEGGGDLGEGVRAVRKQLPCVLWEVMVVMGG